MPNPTDVYIIAPADPRLTVRLSMEEYLKIAPTLNASNTWADQIHNRARVLLVPAGHLAIGFSAN